MPTNSNYRRDKIPMWINILPGIVVLILAFKPILAFANPSPRLRRAIEGNVLANQKCCGELAGRNIATIVATVLALRSQNAMFLAFTMMINLIVREGLICSWASVFQAATWGNHAGGIVLGFPDSVLHCFGGIAENWMHCQNE
ncbi:MAG: hypothetical protein IPN20_15020 [Haliscomenobacter sp.]|nr:hypothetical protein [Haliscomenobacter sp.]